MNELQADQVKIVIKRFVKYTKAAESFFCDLMKFIGRKSSNTMDH